MKARTYIRAMIWSVILSPIAYGAFVLLDLLALQNLNQEQQYLKKDWLSYYFFTDKVIKNAPQFELVDAQYFYQNANPANQSNDHSEKSRFEKSHLEKSGVRFCNSDQLAQIQQQLIDYAKTSKYPLHLRQPELSDSSSQLYLYQQNGCLLFFVQH